MSYEELQELKNSHIEIEYKGETMKYLITDISETFWHFLTTVGTVNIITDGER